MATGTVIHGEDSDGGTGMGWDGQVEFRANLPITIGIPPIGAIWLVEKPTTVLGIIIYQSGLYLKELDTGSLSDWRRLNVKVTFQDNEFMLVKASDNSAKSRFDLSLVSASQTRVLTVQDKDGTIALLSDLSTHGLPTVLGIDNTTGVNDIAISNGQFIIPVNGNVKINPRAFGTNDWYLVTNDGLQNYSKGWLDMHPTYSGLGFNLVNIVMDNNNLQLTTNYLNNTDMSRFTLLAQSMFFQLIDNLTGRAAVIGASNNTLGDVLNGLSVDNIPSYVSSKDVLIKQNVINSGVGGGVGVIIKTDNSWYVQQLIFNSGLAGELKVVHTPNALDFVVTHRAKTGTIAHLDDILKQKSGEKAVITFAGNPKKATVTFATPFADANYSVSVIGQGADNRTWTIETKLAGSFVINANANPVLTNPVLWTATKHGEN